MGDRVHGTLKAILIVTVALLVPCGLLPPGHAAAAAPPGEILRTIDEIDSLGARMAGIDRDYGALMDTLSELTSQSGRTASLLRRARRDYEARRKKLNAKLVSRYKRGKDSWFITLLSYRDLSDFLYKVSLADRLAREEAKVFRAVRDAKNEIQAQENFIEERRGELLSKCSAAMAQKESLKRELDERLKKLASADPVLARVMARPQTGLSRRIDAYLAKRRSPLTGYGIVFVQAEQRTGVSARLLVGLTEAESSCATNGTLYRTNNNAWGMKGPQPRIAGGIPARNGYCNWANWEEAIQEAADFIIHYWGRAQTAMQLKGYCETGGPGSDWERRVETARNRI